MKKTLPTLQIKKELLGVEIKNLTYLEEFVSDNYNCREFNVEEYAIHFFRHLGFKVYFAKTFNSNRLLKDFYLYIPLNKLNYLSIIFNKENKIGIPDLVGFYNDKVYFIEVKSNGDTLRLDQLNWMSEHSEANKIIFAVRCL